MESVERQTGKRPKELDDLVELPDFARYVWQYFLALNAKRGGGFGPSPLTYQEMQAYFTLNQIQVEPWEIQLIDLLDRVAMEHFAEEQKKEQAKKGKK